MAERRRKFGEEIKPEDFSRKIDSYFALEDEMDKWTMPGFLLYCEITKAQYEEMEKKPEYRAACEKVKLHLEDKYCHGLETRNPTGAIFALKNMGWTDEKGIKSTIEVGARLEDVLKGIKVKA